jgi:hypothetical protein
MNDLTLIRDSYGTKETMGKMFDADGNLLAHTIERPWVPDMNHPGGTSFESCVPDGIYNLVPHTRPNGDKVVALVNPELGVWYGKADRPSTWGRYLVLIHSGNYVDHVVGCIAPGSSRTIYENRPMVTSSRATMKTLEVQQYSRLIIEATQGAKDGSG